MPPRGRKKNGTPAISKPGPSKSDETVFELESETDKIAKPLRPSSGRFLKVFQARELGMRYDHSFPERIFQEKVPDYRKIRSHPFSLNKEVVHTGYLFRPGKNAIVGAWYVQLQNMFTTAVGLLHHDLSKVPRRTKYIVLNNTIADACQLHADPDCFVCVTSHAFRNTGEVQIATPGPRGSNGFTIQRYTHPYQKPFWCCNSNHFTDKIAIGCDKEVCMYTVAGIEEIRAISDNVYSLAYNENGTVLNMGCETGEFVLYDQRTCQSIARMKIDNKILDDVLMLADENYCIVSGVSGCLCKVDLRERKPVVEYPGHNRRSKKIPVSVNEEFNLLCSSGADDLTRIWCLKTGKLLHNIPPPTTYPARSCIVPDSKRGNIHLIQDNFIHVYCMLS